MWAIDELQGLCYEKEAEDPKYTQLHEAVETFETYIRNNAAFITNYAERHRYGERYPQGLSKALSMK